MTTRGINFLHEWILANVDKAAPEEQVSVSEMVERLRADAAKAGISVDDMEEDGDSVFEMVFAALEHRREGE
jgi:hypothetical protein